MDFYEKATQEFELYNLRKREKLRKRKVETVYFDKGI